MTDWPHAPVHRLDQAGTYMVTAGTYLKKHHLRNAERRPETTYFHPCSSVFIPAVFIPAHGFARPFVILRSAFRVDAAELRFLLQRPTHMNNPSHPP